MTFEDQLRAYVKQVKEGGDPFTPKQPVSTHEQSVWVSWRAEGNGSTHLEIHVDEERYGYFVNGRRVESSWEGGVDGPNVTSWDTVRKV